MKRYIIIFFITSTTLVYSQAKKEYNIGILLDKNTPEVTSLIKVLQKEIITVIGEDAIVKFPKESIISNNYNLEIAAINYNKLLSNNVDIILAFGVINNAVISKQPNHTKPTILFGTVNKDFEVIDEENKTSGIKNFTYLMTSQSFKSDLSTLKTLSDYTRIGIAIEEPLLKSLPFKKVLDKATLALGVEYKIIPFKTVADIIGNLNPEIDAFYLAGGFLLNDAEIKQLAIKLIKNKTPSITINSTKDVKIGLMASNQGEENLSQFFRRIALNVEATINGENLANLPIHIKSDNTLTINYSTAQNVGVPIKYSIITNTNFVGEFKNVLAEKKYTLLDVMQDVLSNNLSLQASKKEISLSEQNIKMAKSNYLPYLSVSGSGSHVDPNLSEISYGENPEYSTVGNATLTQTLFSETANANISIQKTLLKAQKENYNTEELDAIFNVSNTYFNSLILKANLKIQKQNLDVTKKNLQIANQNFEIGQTSKSDVLRFRSELAQNTQALIEAANLLEQSFFVLNQQLNNPIRLEIDVDEAELGKGVFENYGYKKLKNIINNPTSREPFIAFLIKEAKINAPELNSLEYNIKAVERKIKLNGSGRFVPTLALQGQYNRRFNQWGKGSEPSPILNDNYTIGLNLSLPIFQQNQNRINKQTSVIQKEQLEISESNLELSIDANVNNIVLNLINEISNIEFSKVSEETAKENLDLTQIAYANGAINIVQLLDAQDNFFKAQLSNINASYNYLLGSIQLERNIRYYFILHTKEDNQEFINRFIAFSENQK